MLWDVVVIAFVVLALGAAFGAVPLSLLPGRRRLSRGSVSRDDLSAVLPVAKGADVIPFPAARLDDPAAQDGAASRTRSA
jgi:hypothetical protein